MTARNEEHRDFLDALIVCCEAARDLANRYADEAERLAAAESDRLRAEELTEIARICRKVPWDAGGKLLRGHPSSLAHPHAGDDLRGYPGPGLSPGRIDQYLYPYYQADLEEADPRERQGDPRLLLDQA